MEVQGFSCHGCGSTDVIFDPEARKIHCKQCGKEEYYSRAQLGATGRVAFEKDNAIRFFKEGNTENARKFAGDVLNTMQDNVAALFIMAYCDEFIESRNGSIKNFFVTIDGIALEYDEVRDIKDLFCVALYNLRDYEAEMLILMIKNMQSVEDRDELENFIDAVSPYCISKYPSSYFLTDERVELYCDLVSHCNIPKTCFALLKGIKENPDSPFISNDFYMKAKTEYFYNHYICSVGKIIKFMMDGQYKPKFVTTYQAFLEQYKNDAKIL